MKPKTIHREILLFIDTSFAKKEWCEPGNLGHNEAKNSANQLEKACWSGLIFEVLPGIFNSDDQKIMYIWKVTQAEKFIHVSLGNVPGTAEYETSIDPYLFLRSVSYNN
jgi:hypothetical protein